MFVLDFSVHLVVLTLFDIVSWKKKTSHHVGVTDIFLSTGPGELGAEFRLNIWCHWWHNLQIAMFEGAT